MTSTVSIHEQLQRVNYWQSDYASLESLKQIAKELLALPESDRRHVIYYYNLYSRNKVEESYKLLLLMRLLFDVPENYSGNHTPVYHTFVVLGDWTVDTEGVNFLSPLGYDESGNIILKYESVGWVCYGYCPYYYEGNREYDFFIDHFRLRESADLQ